MSTSNSNNHSPREQSPKSSSSNPSVSKKPTKKTKAPIHINITNCKYDVVKECAEKFGCKIAEEGAPWHLFWIDTGVSTERVLEMKSFQRINHFPGMHEICRKDHLARNLGRLSRIFPRDYAFFPKTWIFPIQWNDFKLHFKQKKNQAFIAKPDHGCQGKGIFLFRNPQQDEHVRDIHRQDMIVQTYVCNPYLLDGYKFDLRVYVLVTSADPLRIFIYKDGLARFATEPYSPPSEKNMSNMCMHLTNYAINRHSEKFIRDEVKGSKRSIQSVFKQLNKERNIDPNKLWDRISDVIIKTIVAVQPQLSRTLKPWLPSNPNVSLNGLGSQCFEILGFDILLDQKLKPWVLEVNHSPSFSCDSPLDKEIKSGVITGALHLLNLSNSYLKKVQKSEKTKSQSRLWKGPQGSNSNMNGSKSENSVRKEDGIQSADSEENQEIPEAERNISHLLSESEIIVLTDETSLFRGVQIVETETLQPRPVKSSSSSSSAVTISESSSVIESPTAQKKLMSKVQEKMVAALKEYLSKYNGDVLATLTERENVKSGMYKRIFPPPDESRLAHYLHLINETSKWSSETATTKARRQYMMDKQKELEKKKKKMAEWREKRSHLLAVKARIDATLSPSLMRYRSRSHTERKMARTLLEPDSDSSDRGEYDYYLPGPTGSRKSLPPTLSSSKSRLGMPSVVQSKKSVPLSMKCPLPLKMSTLTCCPSTLSLTRDPLEVSSGSITKSPRRESLISVRTRLQSLNSTKEALSFLSKHGSVGNTILTQGSSLARSSPHFDFSHGSSGNLNSFLQNSRSFPTRKSLSLWPPASSSMK